MVGPFDDDASFAAALLLRPAAAPGRTRGRLVVMIKVGVLGANGRMGSQYPPVDDAADMAVAAAVDPVTAARRWPGCDVVVDFTHPGAVMDNLRWCIGQAWTRPGTSGFDGPGRRRWGPAGGNARGRVLIVPNFSVGAVLMMRFAAPGGEFFDRRNHRASPCGQGGRAIGHRRRTASLIAAARAGAGLGPAPDATVTAAEGASGAVEDEVHVHSVRLAGLSLTRRCCSAARRDPDPPARLPGPGLVPARDPDGGARRRLAPARPHLRAGPAAGAVAVTAGVAGQASLGPCCPPARCSGSR